MNMFRTLNEQDEKEFREWARKNYTAFEPIKGIWHPVIQDECRKINSAARSMKKQANTKDKLIL